MLAAVLVTGALLGPAGPATAHPLGNFTVNVYAGLTVGATTIAVDYVVDLAEVTTVQATPYIDSDGDGEVTDQERADYGRSGCEQWAGQVSLREDGARLRLKEGHQCDLDAGTGRPDHVADRVSHDR